MKKIWIIISIFLAVMPLVLAFSGSGSNYEIYLGIDGTGSIESSSSNFDLRSNLIYQPIGKFENLNYKVYLGPFYTTTDSDSDSVLNVIDNCLVDYNPTQTDTDEDNVGDACDNCPTVYNPDHLTWVHDHTTTGGSNNCYDCASGQPNTESYAVMDTSRFFSAPDSIHMYAYGDNGGWCTYDYYTCWDSQVDYYNTVEQPDYITFWYNADNGPFDNRFSHTIYLYMCDASDCDINVTLYQNCDLASTSCESGTYPPLMEDCEETKIGDDGRSWCRQTVEWPSTRNTGPFYFKISAFGYRWDWGGQDSWMEIWLDDACTSDVDGNCILSPSDSQSDIDEDEIGDVCDNCWYTANPGQEDTWGITCPEPPYYSDPECGDACEISTTTSTTTAVTTTAGGGGCGGKGIGWGCFMK